MLVINHIYVGGKWLVWGGRVLSSLPLYETLYMYNSNITLYSIKRLILVIIP